MKTENTSHMQSIESAVDSMQKLKSWIDDFIFVYETGKTDLANGVEGWSEQDSVSEFIEKTQSDPQFVQKILNLANCL